MGPLTGLKIIEVAGLGAAPYCGMMLSDLGADVVRVDRPNAHPRVAGTYDVLARGRRSIILDLKKTVAIDTLLRLIERADAVFEGFRPGVAERLGFGPEVCLRRHPGLVYGRLTGWGQSGPLSGSVGHDINYIALSGVLHAIGIKGGRPVPPMNIVGDFGGGGLLLAFGILAALYHSARTGEGQVVDAAMLDGAASFMAMSASAAAAGFFASSPGSSIFSGVAPFYRTYETADEKFIAVGALEPRFLNELIDLAVLDADRVRNAGLEDDLITGDCTDWHELSRSLERVFKQKTRAQWCELLEGTDACVSPVLSFEEVKEHPHNQHRKTFVECNDVTQPAPAPRFSISTNSPPRPPPVPGADTESILKDYGFGKADIAALRNDGII